MDNAAVVYDRRQLIIMKNIIKDLDEGELSYGRLYNFVSDIDALVGCINGVSVEWKKVVNRNVIPIDVICGLMSMNGQVVVSKEDRDAIRNEYLPKISQMIEEYEKQLPEVLDELSLDE